tara:strand:+ start:288 stop:566 length:279 start_codon:yes stop_codon:yes gene_type:complete
MTLKVVPIQSKMPKPTLSEMISSLDNIFNNFTARGEDKLNIVLASLSFCVCNLQKIVGDDKEMMGMLDEVLDQYVDVPEDESYVELITPDTE